MVRSADPPSQPPDLRGGRFWLIGLLAVSLLSGVLGLVCRLHVYTGPGRKFVSDYAIDFAWVPMTTFLLLGMAIPMWRSTCLPRRVVQLGVLGMTVLELCLELAQLGDGAAPYFQQPTGWLQVASNWLHEHQGSVFSWGDMLAFALAGGLTYLALERSGICAPQGSPINLQLMPRGRVARMAVIMLLLPGVMLPTMAEKQGSGSSASANADAGSGSNVDQYGCTAKDRERSKKYAKAKSREMFGSKHWDSLQSLWASESGWCHKAVNPSSGACGIPQALPCSKIPGRSYKSQIDWGLGYIQGRYKNPTNAWRFWKCTYKCKPHPKGPVLKTGKKGKGPEGNWY